MIIVCYAPLTLIIAGIILYLRLGIYGLVIPVQMIIGIKSKQFLKLKNKHSSDRIVISYQPPPSQYSNVNPLFFIEAYK